MAVLYCQDECPILFSAEPAIPNDVRVVHLLENGGFLLQPVWKLKAWCKYRILKTLSFLLNSIAEIDPFG